MKLSNSPCFLYPIWANADTQGTLYGQLYNNLAKVFDRAICGDWNSHLIRNRLTIDSSSS